MAVILADSLKPTIASGETSLMKGYCEAWAIVAANALFPEPGGPGRHLSKRGKEPRSAYRAVGG